MQTNKQIHPSKIISLPHIAQYLLVSWQQKELAKYLEDANVNLIRAMICISKKATWEGVI